jgi:hypothetical protein
MSKVYIQQIGNRNYPSTPIVLTWEEYQTFCLRVPGEGVTWRAVLA